jgi:HlyD family secretion protein
MGAPFANWIRQTDLHQAENSHFCLRSPAHRPAWGAVATVGVSLLLKKPHAKRWVCSGLPCGKTLLTMVKDTLVAPCSDHAAALAPINLQDTQLMTTPTSSVATTSAAAPIPQAKLTASLNGVEPASLLDEPLRKPWYRRTSILAAVLLVAVVSSGAWWWRARQAANALPSYNTQAAAHGNLTLTVTANGTLQPTRSISIGSELSGTVLKVNADVNDRIKKGQVLVELDTAKLRDQTLRSGAALLSAKALVEQSAATVVEAQANWNRFEEVARLSGGKVPSKSELDGSHAALARALASQASARAGVSEAQATVSTDQTNLTKASIKAPADGIVLTRSVDPGNAVAASLQAVTLFTVAENLAKLRLWVYVDEADVSAVKVGQDASFTVSAWVSRKFPARITRVGFGSTITDNVVTYLTYLDVDNTDLSLRPGMTATAAIVAMQRNDVLLVPNTALRFTPTDITSQTATKNGMLSSLTPRMPNTRARKSAAAGASTALAKQVWVLPAGGTGEPVAVAVTPGISDGHMTEITGGDLQVGMLVITDQKTASKP